jgi:hypothetical protein
MLEIQIEQISYRFKFIYQDEEVVITEVNGDEKSLDAIVSICATSGFAIKGNLTKGFIAEHLKQTNQLHLLDITYISIGSNIIELFDFKKITTGAGKGLYNISSKPTSCGGKPPMSLIEIGVNALEGVSKRSFNLWLNTFKQMNK